MRILILSHNILGDQNFQQNLQKMNYEVMVSSSVFLELCCHQPDDALLSVFPIVFISETFTDAEVKQLLPDLVTRNVTVIRRVYSVPAETEMAQWRGQGLTRTLAVEANQLEIRELIEDISEQMHLETESVLAPRSYKCKTPQANLFSKISFSSLERKIIELLYEKKEETASIEEIGEVLWPAKAMNHSRKTQVYASISQIKNKLAKYDKNAEYVLSKWGQGYILMDNFYEDFTL